MVRSPGAVIVGSIGLLPGSGSG
eukprot:SAG22_NODE_3423_length_1720_cov_1.367057_1_plen_22_part_10